MFQIWYFWTKFQFCTWNWLFGLHNKFVSFSINSTKNLKTCSDNVQNISRFTFNLSNWFKHFSFSNYLFVTLRLPQLLTDGEASKADKMSSTHPNLNPSDFMDFISQGEHMRKKPIFRFWVQPIVTLKP